MLDIVIENFKNNKNFYFVQIGANNGITNDPLYDFINKYNPNGLLIEPINSVYNKLLNTYKNNKKLKFENIGIYNKSENIIFYKIKDSHVNIFKKYYKKSSNPSGITSLYKEHLISFIKKNNLDKFDEIDNFIEEIKIMCLTFNDLILKHNINHINLLQIDAERYDFDIIRQVLEKSLIRPDIINFEIKNINTNINIKKYFEKYNYINFIYHGNDLCVYK